MRVKNLITFLLIPWIAFSVCLPGAAAGAPKHNKVLLTWNPLEDAVAYELEISKVPEKNRNASGKPDNVVYRTNTIYAPGVEIDLAAINAGTKNLYYRVRALDLDKQPKSNYTRSRPLSSGILDLNKPYPTAVYNSRRPVPLYLVYSWIPVRNADHYEVEVLTHSPENPNGTRPSQYELNHYTIQGGTSFDCYDFYPYTQAGTYYWRVIAMDSSNNAIGGYSDAIPFTVKTGKVKFAALGDSITHGGGAVSNPPSDIRFDYTSYLPFPVKNLGRSGDTIAAAVERFDHDVLPFKPTYLLVLLGSNSLRGGTSADEVIQSFEELKEKCQANGITPIFLTIPPLNPERIERVFGQPTYEDWQTEIGKVNDYLRQQAYVVDIAPLLTGADGLLPTQYSTDGLHEDIFGKRIMGEAVARFLKTFVQQVDK